MQACSYLTITDRQYGSFPGIIPVFPRCGRIVRAQRSEALPSPICLSRVLCVAPPCPPTLAHLQAAPRGPVRSVTHSGKKASDSPEPSSRGQIASYLSPSQNRPGANATVWCCGGVLCHPSLEPSQPVRPSPRTHVALAPHTVDPSLSGSEGANRLLPLTQPASAGRRRHCVALWVCALPPLP